MNLATCYQLAQSVLKIGSALAERVGQGEVGACIALGVQTSVENGRFTSISGFLGSFQSGGAFSGQRALTIKYSVMSVCGYEPAKDC